MAWLSGWTYRKTVSITGQTGAGTNYQVELSIGDASGGDFHLESHCTSFPNDIQVTDNDQTTTLNYWVEDLTVDPIKMWVEVVDDLGSNRDIYVYYGKSAESSASSISTTFMFGDDFESDSWTKVGSRITYDNTNKRLNFQLYRDNTKDQAYHAHSVGTGNWIQEYKVRFSVLSGSNIAGMIGGYRENAESVRDAYVNSRDGVAYSVEDDECKALAVNNGAISSGTYVTALSINTLYNVRVSRTGSTFYLKIFDSNWTEVASTSVTYAGTAALSYVSIDSWHDNYAPSEHADGWIDDFRVRKYNATEPAFSSAGSEEIWGLGTYYFNSKSTSVWTDAAKMIDNILTNYAYTTSDGDTEVLDGNTGPGTDLGAITKVEIRAYAYGDGGDRIDLTPIFSGGAGDEHPTTPGVSPGSWGQYQEITSDTNHPSPWTWSAIQTLDCTVEMAAVAKANTMYCAKVEIRVTYTPPGEGVTRSYGFIFG